MVPNHVSYHYLNTAIGVLCGSRTRSFQLLKLLRMPISPIGHVLFAPRRRRAILSQMDYRAFGSRPMERISRIKLETSPWQGLVLSLNYTRIGTLVGTRTRVLLLEREMT